MTSRKAEIRALERFNRRRSAFHESGHGLTRYLLTGQPPELLSLRPGQSFNAIAISGPRVGSSWSGDADELLHIPSLAWPADLRAELETLIVIALAGDIAATMAGYRGDAGYVEPSDDEVAAETQAQALAALSPRRRELLTSAEARPTSLSDDERAWGNSFALTGHNDEALAHLAWLRVVTSRLIADHADSLTRLADALVVANVMDADAFVPVARSGRCTCHSWSSNSDSIERKSRMPSKAVPGSDHATYQVVVGFVLDTPAGPFAPAVGTTWRGDNPAIVALRAAGGIGKFILPAEATEEDLAATRALAEERIYPDEPPPAPRPMVRALERVEYLAGHVANPIGAVEGTGWDGSAVVMPFNGPPTPVLQIVEPGAIIPADSAIVAARPHSFTPEAA